MVLCSQVAVEMGSLRNQRIQLLKGMTGTGYSHASTHSCFHGYVISRLTPSPLPSPQGALKTQRPRPR